jgi:two-component system alkaline phosphatase synthesis response regulator PhoP
MTTVLVVDAEPAGLQSTHGLLAREGYTVHSVTNGEDALRLARRVQPDLVIFDVMLPGPLDGWEACRHLRQESNVPIILLTARTDEVDPVVGLELGADDYITKPFNPRELEARVRAVLRRSNVTRLSRSVLTVADICIDPNRYEVTIGGLPVVLALKEFKLLAVLARYPGNVVPRERLLQLVWPEGRSRTSRALDVHISWLRQKLRSSSVRIERVWGVGYRLVTMGQYAQPQRLQI